MALIAKAIDMPSARERDMQTLLPQVFIGDAAGFPTSTLLW
jgi:hypothetical protein